MEHLLTDPTRLLTPEEKSFFDARSEGGTWLGWVLAALLLVLSVGSIVVPFAIGEIWVGIFATIAFALIFGFIWKNRLTDLPDLEEPLVTSWRGRLVQRVSGLRPTFRFGGRQVYLPDHWVEFIPGDREVSAEAAVLPNEENPFLVSTSTGLSVEKEVEWGLLETFWARPGRRIAFYLGGVFILFYLGVAGVEISESKPLLEILLLGRIGIVGLGFTAGFFLLGMPGLYFFIKHRLSLWRIRENYRAEGVEGVPSREEFTKIKAEQIAFMSAIGVPLMTILSWLVFGLPLVGLVAGMIGGVWMGYFSRNLSPWR